ncbi:MAG: hypothetical protein ABI634_15045 [Acidobacteriota bacterium]
MARVRRSSSPNSRSRLFRTRHWTAVGGVLASIAMAGPAQGRTVATTADDWENRDDGQRTLLFDLDTAIRRSLSMCP